VLPTPFCELFEIDAPILQAAIWPATSPELVAAVSEAGALGTIAGIFGTRESLVEQMARVRGLTDRPFVVNHVVPSLDEDAFQATLDARPAAVSFALGHPRRRIVDSDSEDTVHFEAWSSIVPRAPPGAYEVVPQTAGLIGDVWPAAEIVRDLVTGAERPLELG
jgi:NAD(P)H-dependent flavin oxidoreductase YrpB (nitropropane dioxygenase family)